MSSYQDVAAEVRAEMARKQLSGVRAAQTLGWTQNYISRRLSGRVPFDVEDLTAIADLLEVPVSTFFETGPGVRIPGTSAPAPARIAGRPVGIAA